MKHISILVPNGAVALGCIEGPFILFNKANEFLTNLAKKPLFSLQLVGLTNEEQVYNRLFRVSPDIVIGDLAKTDLIIITAVNGEMKKVIESNKDFLPWIINQYKEGAEVASLCVGAPESHVLEHIYRDWFYASLVSSETCRAFSLNILIFISLFFYFLSTLPLNLRYYS